MQNSMLVEVGRFFGDKIVRLGPSPAGADFNSEAAQTTRFIQFVRLLDFSKPFSLIDFGCGYGALASYLLDLGLPLQRYVGFDISREMIEAARPRISAALEARLTTELADIGTADFAVASGIFNVKLDADTMAWHQHIVETLDILSRASIRGFAFNMLTAYSDRDRMRPDLYYGDPCWFFHHCRKFSRNLVLLHDYELFDWTISVRLDQ